MNNIRLQTHFYMDAQSKSDVNDAHLASRNNFVPTFVLPKVSLQKDHEELSREPRGRHVMSHLQESKFCHARRRDRPSQ